MKKNKNQMVIDKILNQLTKFQMHSQDMEFFNWCEDLRQSIVDFENNIVVKNFCEKCGCNEFLCGHNKRG